MSSGSGVRDVARRAVQAEIESVAHALFREQGYDATTVDQIAERIGMSQRTFFRHAGTKEDLVLGDFLRRGEQMVQVLTTRPRQECPWDSLRRAFDAFTVDQRDSQERDRAKLLRSIVESSPNLRAVYLERMDIIQRRLAEELLTRDSSSAGRSVMRAVVGAAFAALYAATENCDALVEAGGGNALTQELDRVMAHLRPAVFETSTS